MLFNLVVQDIAGELETIKHLKHTVYTDGITILTDWSTDGKTATAAVQRGLDAIEWRLAATGMMASSVKTQYVVLGGVDLTRANVDIRLGGQRIERAAARWIRILGVPLHEDGGADEWIRQLKVTWRQQFHIIRRMGDRFGGAVTQAMRRLTQAVLTLKAYYGAVCFELNQAQHVQLETLHCECLRAITGLPRHTRIEELYRFARLPLLRHIIEERCK